MRARPCHFQGQEIMLNTCCDVYVFQHPEYVGEWKTVFILHRTTKLQRQADATLQSQDPTFAMCIEVLTFLGSYWQTEEGGRGPCARVHGLLGAIQAALCTPREWGLAYIECLCCGIESVEHLCLSSLTVKLGLTKNPSYSNRKWSRVFFPLNPVLHKIAFMRVFMGKSIFFKLKCQFYIKLYNI